MFVEFVIDTIMYVAKKGRWWSTKTTQRNSSPSLGLFSAWLVLPRRPLIEMAEIKHFSIFNDTFGLKEDNAEEKIMYFFPPEASMNEKMRSTGLSMAFINFAR